MKFRECPECGANNGLTRRRCARCGAGLAGGTLVELNKPALAPYKGEALAIAAGAFIGALSGALLWLTQVLDPLWELLSEAEVNLTPLGELLYVATSVMGMMAGMLVGAVVAAALFALSQGE